MKFLLTRELGRLGRWLRILGFDTLYTKEENISRVIIQALRTSRIIITRNKRFLEHPGVTLFIIKSNDYQKQLKELREHFNISVDEERMFCRCIICNELLKKIEKEETRDRVPGYVYKTQEEFYICPGCQRIYWQGSHWGNVKEVLRKIGWLEI